MSAPKRCQVILLSKDLLTAWINGKNTVRELRRLLLKENENLLKEVVYLHEIKQEKWEIVYISRKSYEKVEWTLEELKNPYQLVVLKHLPRICFFFDSDEDNIFCNKIKVFFIDTGPSYLMLVHRLSIVDIRFTDLLFMPVNSDAKWYVLNKSSIESFVIFIQQILYMRNHIVDRKTGFNVVCKTSCVLNSFWNEEIPLFDKSIVIYQYISLYNGCGRFEIKFSDFQNNKIDSFTFVLSKNLRLSDTTFYKDIQENIILNPTVTTYELNSEIFTNKFFLKNYIHNLEQYGNNKTLLINKIVQLNVPTNNIFVETRFDENSNERYSNFNNSNTSEKFDLLLKNLNLKSSIHQQMIVLLDQQKKILISRDFKSITIKEASNIVKNITLSLSELKKDNSIYTISQKDSWSSKRLSLLNWSSFNASRQSNQTFNLISNTRNLFSWWKLSDNDTDDNLVSFVKLKNSNISFKLLHKKLVFLTIILSTKITWTNNFINKNELAYISNVIKKYHKKNKEIYFFNIIQIEYIKYLKVILNTKNGLDNIIKDNKDIIIFISKCLIWKNYLIKTHAYEILTIFYLLHAPNGYLLTLDVLNILKIAKKDSENSQKYYIYYILFFEWMVKSFEISNLSLSFTDINVFLNHKWESIQAGSTLINTLINSFKNLDEKNYFRSNLINKGLKNILEYLRKNYLLNKIHTQIKTFEKRKLKDMNELQQIIITTKLKEDIYIVDLLKTFCTVERKNILDDILAILRNIVGNLIFNDDYQQEKKINIVKIFIESLKLLYKVNEDYWPQFMLSYSKRIEDLIGKYLFVKSVNVSDFLFIQKSFISELELFYKRVSHFLIKRNVLEKKLLKKKREIGILRSILFDISHPKTELPSYEYFSSVIQLLVQKEKQVIELQTKIVQLSKKTLDRHILDGEKKHYCTKRNKQITILIEKITKYKSKIEEIKNILNFKKKEILYLRMILKSIYTRYKQTLVLPGNNDLIITNRFIEDSILNNTSKIFDEKNHEIAKLKSTLKNLKQEIGPKSFEEISSLLKYNKVKIPKVFKTKFRNNNYGEVFNVVFDNHNLISKNCFNESETKYQCNDNKSESNKSVLDVSNSIESKNIEIVIQPLICNTNVDFENKAKCDLFSEIKTHQISTISTSNETLDMEHDKDLSRLDHISIIDRVSLSLTPLPPPPPLPSLLSSLSSMPPSPPISPLPPISFSILSSPLSSPLSSLSSPTSSFTSLSSSTSDSLYSILLNDVLLGSSSSNALYSEFNLNVLQKQPKKPLKPLFWCKLSSQKIIRTIWEKDILLPSIDYSLIANDLEKYFYKDILQLNSNSYDINNKKKVTTISLIELNRANNTAIMLSKIKLNYNEIRDALLELNDSKLSIDNLKAIKQNLPTTEEIRVIKEYSGDESILGNVEKYFKKIMVIPRLSERLDCMIYRQRFEPEINEIQPDLKVLYNTCFELRKSKKFRTLLGFILVIGNYLNFSTFRGNASGFQIDTLLKLVDVKASGLFLKKIPNLLHYIVSVFITYSKETLLFSDEVTHLSIASKISSQALFNTTRFLYNELKNIYQEISILKNRTISNIDRFVDVMTEFYNHAMPIVDEINRVSKETEAFIRETLLYFGEDPNQILIEDFFGIIMTFNDLIKKAISCNENVQMKFYNEKI
ncbi:hypothetical protein PMAC_001766 [Pneumocystis sp. 'macacae']|nr:hypothetical protein PMAC_001766 [Pneumocystis sp. 'macacae']